MSAWASLLTLSTVAGACLLSLPAMAQQRTMAASVTRAINQSAVRTIGNLPVRSTMASRLAGDHGNFSVSDDLASGGHTMTVDQVDGKIVINWDSFDIGKNYVVKFQQPTNGAALNNIWSNDPSVILGSIQANGEVILQNQNGIIFGPTARIDTGRFVATALSLANETFLAGLRTVQTGAPVFGSDNENRNGFITVERGAEIKTLAGGDVIMVAPKVYNEGRIETPQGQTILAAGQKVYLYASDNTVQRGLMVAVDAFDAQEGDPADLGTVEQAAAGSYKTVNGQTVDDATPSNTAGLETRINQIVADEGTINLVGLTVRQNGVLSATTAVKGANGGIYLQAMRDTYQADDTKGPRLAKTLGTVELGSASVTSVTPSTSDDTQTSSEAFYRSRVNIDGADVRLRSGAYVQAVSGNIQIRAVEDAQTSALFGQQGGGIDNSSLVIEDGVTLTAAGLRDVLLPMTRNQLSTQLFQIDLADSPVQRNGVLYRKTIYADARQPVSVADVTGYYSLIGRTARELSTRGGNVMIASLGHTVVADGAKVDISGGSVRYATGKIASSFLAGSQGVVAIESADPSVRYSSLINPDLDSVSATNTDSYVEGADAGYLSVLGQTLYFGASIDASVVLGPLQRAGGQISGYDMVYSTNEGAYSLLSDELGWAHELADSPWLYASLTPSAGTVSFGTSLGVTVSPQLSAIHVVKTAGAPLTSVPESGTEAAQALTEQLAASGLVLSSTALQASGLSHLNLAATTVDMAADASLNLGASGSLAIHALGDVTLAGQIVAEGGSVSVNAEGTDADVTLASTAVIDVSGRMADERGSSTADAVQVNGGSVSLSAAGSVDVRGATIDVSGGYWRTAAGSSKGTAGSISLSANAEQGDASPREGRILIDGVRWSGYDFKQGGTLTLAGMRTLLVGTVSDDEAAAWADGLQLSADFFSAGGFGTFDLSALGDVKVAEGTQIVARKQNLALSQRSTRSLRGTSSAETVGITTLSDGLRGGVNLSLTASTTPDRTAGAGQNVFSEGGSVFIGQGALVDVGAGGSVDLSAGRRMEVAGTVRAQGGEVSMALSGTRAAAVGQTTETSSNDIGYVADQEIRLTSTAVVDVSGVAQTVAVGNRLTGSVLAGGTVSLGKQRGTVVTEAGSLIDVSGASADLNLGATTAKTTVKTGAGTVNIASGDGFTLQGDFRAWRPDVTVSGGAFNATLSLSGGTDVVSGLGAAQAYPDGVRDILLLGTQDELAAQLTADGAVFKRGLLATGSLIDAGFDRIALQSDERITLGAGANLVSPATAGTHQAALRSVTLDTRQLVAGDSASHTVQAGYVALGNKSLAQNSNVAVEEAAAAATTAGAAALTVNASLIEVYGHAGLSGFGNTHLQATLAADQGSLSRTDGEIRFIGRTQDVSQADVTGALHFTGDLTLQAGNVYTSTLSAFTVQGDGSDAHLTVQAPAAGSTAQSPLSALGHLTLAAPDITLDGTLIQPFGQITVSATKTLTVGEHAALSVSGNGLIVPVGTTLNGAMWTYATNGTQNGVSVVEKDVQGLDDLSLLKGITLTSDTLTLADAAHLSAGAGGDLQAWEFVSGVGGSSDVLNTAGYYAILPGYTYDYAPYDTEVAATTQAEGGSLKAGDQVTITSANGVLATGTYTLLPARYALLPGAVLVSSASLTAGTTLTTGQVLDDGSVTVGGYLTSAGTAIGSSQVGAALVLAPQATVLGRSAYTLTSINDYKAAQAAAAGDSVADTPGAAGRIALGANNAFDVGAQFDLNGGGELDLWMGSKMAIVSGDAAAPEGYASVSVESLEATGAASVLLGGRREGTVGDATATALADEVLWTTSVDTDTALISVATNLVSVADGLTLRYTGAASSEPSTLTLSGLGAALVLSGQLDGNLTRDLSGVLAGTPLTGTVRIGEGVTLAGTAVQIDGAAAVQLAESTHFEARAMSLGARDMVLGGSAASGDPTTLALSDTQLQALTQLEVLSLHSTRRIDLADSLSLGQLGADGTPLLRSLVLDAATVRGTGSADDTVTLTAQNVSLRHTGADTADTSSPDTAGTSGLSTLVVQSHPAVNDTQTGGITIGPGVQQLAFVHTTLQTTGDIVFTGQGSLNAQGDVSLQAARITATSLAQQALNAEGSLTIAPVASDSRTLGETAGVGATVALSGSSVSQGGRIELPSGTLNVQGRDAVRFEAGSLTSTAGGSTAAGSNWSVSRPGGDITATSTQGDLTVNGTLDVSAGALTSASDSAKTAGTLSLNATQGQLVLGESAQLIGTADTDTLSGKLVVDAQGVRDGDAVTAATTRGTLDRLATLATTGQMRGGLNWRLRAGDQSLDTAMQAVRVNLSTDAGKLTLMSKAAINASAPQGGVVSLSGGKGLALDTGARITADSTRSGANGGDVLLNASTGELTLASGVTISAQGDDALDGRIVLRTGIDADALATELAKDESERDYTQALKLSLADPAGLHAGEVSVEAVQVYDSREAAAAGDDGVFTADSDGTGLMLNLAGGALNDRIASDAAGLMDHAGTLVAALGLDKVDGSGSLRYGVELRTDQDLALRSDWNLADLRVGDAPIFLTVRSAGTLDIEANVSDGYAKATRATATASSPSTMLDGDAASYRLAAGADLSAADLLATQASADTGDLIVGSGKLVRTTAGSIELAAGRDVVLTAGTGSTPVQGVVYVAGRPDTLDDNASMESAVNNWAQFTSHGGRLEVSAQRDVSAPGFTQLIGNWLLHTGSVAGTEAWWTATDMFKQGFGSFGGGNIMVSAGRDLLNVGVVAPTSYYQTSTANANGSFSYSGYLSNGGNVTVQAGRDILGGVYLLGRGQGLIQADGALLQGTSFDGSDTFAQNAFLGLLDGQWTVQTRGDLNLGLVYDPTVLPTGTRVSTLAGNYYTYGADAALSASSTAGSLNWTLPTSVNSLTGVSAKTNWHNAFAATKEKTATETFNYMLNIALVAPPTVHLSAGGDLNLAFGASSTNEVLFPSAQGDLSLQAGGAISLLSGSLLLGDSNPAIWPTVGNPAASIRTFKWPQDIGASSSYSALQTGSSLHAEDDLPVRIHAGGDLSFANEQSELILAKSAEIEAGGDILNLNLQVEHFDDQDVSVVSAGGNLIGASKPTNKNDRAIRVAGPGELRVSAGHDIDLNNGDGIVALGNTTNDQLPDQSAIVRVAAGTAKSVSLADFRSLYLDGDAQAQAALIAYVRAALALPDAAVPDFAQAWSLFASLSAAHQRTLADQVLDAAFVKSFVADGQRYASAWASAAAAAGVSVADVSGSAFQRFKDEVVISEMKRIGSLATKVADSTDANVNAQRQAERQALWNELNQVLSLAGMGAGYATQGSINVAGSKIHTLAPGNHEAGGIRLFAPGGDVIVGLTANNSNGQGIVTAYGGNIDAIVLGDFQVNSQKTFVVGEGDLSIYAVQGAIDSGRGSNSAVAAPQSSMKLVDGYPTLVPGSATTGSGLAVLPLTDGTVDGNINLFAPVGGVIALDTFIRASGDINVAGPVKGGDNLKGGSVSTTTVAVATGPSLSLGPTLRTDTAAGAEAADLRLQ